MKPETSSSVTGYHISLSEKAERNIATTGTAALTDTGEETAEFLRQYEQKIKHILTEFRE